MTDNICLLCSIATGAEKEIKVILQNDHWVAFLDPHPDTAGHMVVAAKKHLATILDIPATEYVSFVEAIRDSISLIKKVLRPDGFNVGWNQEQAGGQLTPHLHAHILPRWSDDGGGSVHSIVHQEVNFENIKRQFQDYLK